MPRKQTKIRELFLPLLKPKGKGRKEKITAALREAVWIRKMGRVFEAKCPVIWCPNIITVFDFQSGHNIPESKGGKTNIDNLLPICARCNVCMGDRYTIDEWSKMYMSEKIQVPAPAPTPVKKSWWQRLRCF
jgi:5-methylcytosine-specific restriction endonuclease McrA